MIFQAIMQLGLLEIELKLMEPILFPAYVHYYLAESRRPTETIRAKLY